MVSVRRGLLAAAPFALALTATTSEAAACDPAANNILGVQDTGSGEAPSGIGEVSVSINRGNGPGSLGCGRQSSSSCDDLGSFQLHFAPATDADSPASEVGYRVDLVEGAAPGASLEGSDGRVLLPSTEGREATLYFHWLDGSTDDQEGVDFTVTLTPVDADGNEGPVSRPIRIRDDGDGGCAVRTPRFASWKASLLATLVVSGVALGRRLKKPLTP